MRTALLTVALLCHVTRPQFLLVLDLVDLCTSSEGLSGAHGSISDFGGLLVGLFGDLVGILLIKLNVAQKSKTLWPLQRLKAATLRIKIAHLLSERHWTGEVSFLAACLVHASQPCDQAAPTTGLILKAWPAGSVVS